MIVRLVQMSFEPENVDVFLTLFKKYQSQIRSSEGCLELRLIQDQKQPNLISTLSYWEDEKHLYKYRKSSLFGEVWPLTKKLFSYAPKAISYDVLTID
jgi:quinol monooxygenase YgiN